MKVRLILILPVLAIGCTSKLETGYEPRKLGASDTQLRALYAPRFSPEMQAAQADRQERFDARRPGS